MRCFLFLTVLFFTIFGDGKAARILGVFPHIGKSHYIMFEPMMKALAAKGHEVVILTQFPMKTIPPNIKIVDLNGTMNVPYVNAVPIAITPGERFNLLCIYEIARMGIDNCENVLSSKPISEFLASKQTFDLVFYEIFNADCFLGFVHRFKAPSIAVSSSALMPWASSRFGLPDNPSYISNHFTGFPDEMNYLERFLNTISYITSKIVFSLLADGQNAEIAKRYFGNDLPPLDEIARNTSFFFVNTHFSLTQVRPYPPNVAEIGGIHIEPPGKLNEELKNFLDNAKEGVVYFSLGSTARGASLSPEKRDAFIEAFRGLKQQVLWKWEDDDIPKKPKNVKNVKWLPQTAVLAHPNVRAFMTHGGLMGLLEAVHFGVPMICIPLFGDQFNNVAMAVKKGIAVKLPLEDVTTERVTNALNEVLNDKSYKKNAKLVSLAFHDRSTSPVDTFVYWTEYVLRFKGASNLRSSAKDLSLLQYLLLDVILCLSIIPLTMLFLFGIFVRYVLRRRKKGTKSRSKPKQKRS